MPGVVQRLVVRLVAFIRRDETDRGIDDELRYHLERETERLVGRGMTSHDARLAARRAFGNPTAHAEEARDALRWTWLEQLRQDLRYALRALRATPAFTTVAALSLALGVGANVAIFSAADALLHRRLPVRSPERLYSTNGGVYSMYKDFARLGDPFAGAAAVAIVDRTNVSIAGYHRAGMTRVALASGGYFQFLGIGAAIGRTLALSDDESIDGHSVAVISHRLWRDQLGARPDVLGSVVEVNNNRFTIVGVAARGFDGDAVGRPVDVWVPTMMQSEVMTEMPGLIARDAGFLRVLVRTNGRVNHEQAQRAIQPAYQAHEIRAAGSNATPEFRRSLANDPLQLVPVENGYSPNRDDARQSIRLLFGVVLLVLAIACTNVATLFLVRGAARAREMAVRAAIGAGRGRLIRQVLTEAVVLSLIGGVLGIVIAFWGTTALSTDLSLGPVQLDVRASAVQSLDFRPSAFAYVLAAATSMVAGVLFGLIPALRAATASREFSMIGRRAAIGGTTRTRLGGALVVAQIGLSVVLLVVTGLLVRSLTNLRRRDLGLDRSHLLLAWTIPAQTGLTANEYPLYLERVIDKLSAIPGVAAVSATNKGVLEGGDVGGESNLLTIDGEPARAGLQVLRAAVGPSFFSAAGMHFIEGRDFRASDDSSAAKVGIISETMARYLFGTSSPIGKRLGAPKNPIEIIGVVRDTKHGSPRDRRGVWYVTYKQSPGLLRSMCIVIRARANPESLRPAIARALRELDPRLPVLRIDTIAEQLNDVLFTERMLAGLAIVFAALAALLACIGLYGVMAYGVARRTSEIGVRVALGATSGTVVRLVLGDSTRIAALGVAVGIPAAFGVARLARSRLYDISPNDPATMIGAAALMLLVAAAAGFLPARRAAAIDPAVTLRTD